MVPWCPTSHTHHRNTGIYKTVEWQDGGVRMSSRTGQKEQVDVYLPDELLEQVESQLDYGDSLSGWIREATQQRIERETDEN